MEVLALGVLVFVVGTLVVANAWAVVDARLAVGTAAREATRAYVETAPGDDPVARAEASAQDAIAGLGRRADRLTLRLIDGTLARCRLVRFEATYPVPSVLVPWLGDSSPQFTATARYAEVVDPFRSGLAGTAGDCDGRR